MWLNRGDLDERTDSDQWIPRTEQRPPCYHDPGLRAVRTRKLRVALTPASVPTLRNQIHSFAAQNAYYTELITGNPEWEFVDVYADEGITGTSAEKRDDFQRLLKDCRRGRIDKVLTKSTARSRETPVRA